MILTGYFNTLSIKNIKKKVVDLEALSVNITYWKRKIYNPISLKNLIKPASN